MSASGAPETDGYTVAPHPPLVSQVCLRCGAQVGIRSIHDGWHTEQDKALDDLTDSLRRLDRRTLR